MKRPWHALFTHDTGRKVLALFFALVLFEIIDSKVQESDRKSFHVLYVDEAELGPMVEDRFGESVLLVAQRAPSARSLIVASRPRPDACTLVLHAPKESLQQVKERRFRLVYRLAKEGALEPTVDELDGIEALRKALGVGASIEFAQPLRLDVEPERESPPLVLEAEDVTLRGNVAAGYDPRPRSAVFRPPEVRLVGPERMLQQLALRRSEVFEPLDLNGQAGEVSDDLVLASTWEPEVRLEDATGARISSVKVVLQFERHMVPVPAPDGTFERSVQVLYDDELIKRKDERRSVRDGWRLQFDNAVAGELKLKLQILVPEAQAPLARERVKIGLAKDNVELVVRAHDAAGADRATVSVLIQKFADFPDDLDVAFEGGVKKVEVPVTWTRGEPSAAPTSTRTGEEKGGHGGP